MNKIMQPIRCSLAVDGKIKKDPKNDTKCDFKPEQDTPQATATGSLMFFRLPFYKKVCVSMFIQSIIDMEVGFSIIMVISI